MDKNIASSDPYVEAIRAAVRIEVRDAVREAIAEYRSADEWLLLADVGVPVRTLRVAIRTGELAARKAGRNLVVRRSDVDAWLAARPLRPVAAATPAQGEDPLVAALAAGRLKVVR